MSKALEFLVSEDRHSMSKIADIAAVGKIEAAQVHDGYFQKKICWDIRVEHPQMAYYIRLIWGPVAKFQDMIEAFEFDQSALQKEIMIGTVLLNPMSGVTMDNMHQDPRFRELERRTSKITTTEGLCYTCIHQL